MAKRGRPRKVETPNKLKEVKSELKTLEVIKQEELKKLYEDLAEIKKKVDLALTHIGFIDGTESLAEAAFKGGRAYGPLDEANDKLQEMLENIYEANDFDHWDWINN